jgi:hypothetical protein
MYSQPSSTVTQVTEETQVYQIPSRQQQQHNEITYSIQGTQPKFQPVSFVVSATQENTQPTITTDEDQSMITDTYQLYGTQFNTRPNQTILSPYEDDTSTTTTRTITSSYSQQQPQNNRLLATVARQAGPTVSHYQQPVSHESDSMQTESEASSVRYVHSSQQPTSTSVISSRPNFTKVCQLNYHFILNIII